MLTFCFYFIGFLSFFSILRLLLGPTLWDRLLAFNVFSAKLVLLIIIYATLHEKSYLLDLAITYALLSFISTLFISETVRKRGDL